MPPQRLRAARQRRRGRPLLLAALPPAQARSAAVVLRPCIDCGRLIESGSRCPTHELPRDRGARWKRLRRIVFATKGGECWRCGGPATEVDHVVPIRDGGTDRLDNLRPVCSKCNRGSNP